MKLLILFNILIYTNESFSTTNFIGTPPRMEKEYKITLVEKNVSDYQCIIKTIEKSLKDLFPLKKTKTYFFKSELKNKINDKNLDFNSNNIKLSILAEKQMNKRIFQKQGFHFDHFLKTQYHLQSMQEVRFFVDHYYDTQKKELLSRKIFYRLRKRWRNYGSYIFSFMNEPLRTEIQTKEYIKSSQFLSAWDTRLEYNQVQKLNSNNPNKPRKNHFFSQMLFSGIYQGHKTWPYSRLNLNASAGLSPLIDIETFRKRFHILNENPWGSGNNPDHIFLISIDRVQAHCPKGHSCDDSKNIIEIEIELERNISKNLEQVLNLDTSQMSPFSKIVLKSTQSGTTYLMKDLQLIYKNLLDSVKRELPNREIIGSKPKVQYFINSVEEY